MKIAFDITNDNNAKLEILISVFNAMVTYIKELRETTERLVVGGCTLIILITSWILTSDNFTSSQDKRVISVGISIFVSLALCVIKILQSRFNGYASVLRKINEVQLMYEKGIFLKEDCLYPENWKSFGTYKWKEPIFRIGYFSLIFLTLFCISSIWYLK